MEHEYQLDASCSPYLGGVCFVASYLLQQVKLLRGCVGDFCSINKSISDCRVDLKPHFVSL